MGVTKRLYHIRHLGRVDEPRWSRPLAPTTRPATTRARTEHERLAAVYRRSKRVQLVMFAEEV
jgi:hypothetical protein